MEKNVARATIEAEPLPPTPSEIQDVDTFFPRDATEDEIDTYPHVVDKIPLRVWAVMITGSAERFAYYTIVSIWQNYIQNPRSSIAVPGALGLGQSTATNISNAFFFFSFLTPMPFALLSDCYLGRYKTLLLALGLYLCGCVTMFVTSLPVALDRGAGIPGLVTSMVFIGLGVGGVKATFSPFLGDQVLQRKPQLTRSKNGDLVVIDRTRTLQFVYNAFYWFTNIASMSSVPSTFLEKDCGFWTAYLMGLVALGIAVVPLVIWSRDLVKFGPKANILPTAARTLICAAKSGRKLENAKPSYQLVHYGRTVPWTDKFVEEMKRGLIACRVILSFVFFYLSIGQMYNNLVSQAGQMQLNGVPNDLIPAMAGAACVLFGPIIQGLYSFLAARRIHFGPILRISVAFIFCGAGMGYAAGVQRLIYSSGPCYKYPLACAASDGGKSPNEVNVWIQLPVYFALAIAEIFGLVTVSELAYSQAPLDMRTIVQALTQWSACLASALGMAISPAAKDPHLMIMYTCLAVVMGICSVLFYWKFKKYDRIEKETRLLDDVGEGNQSRETVSTTP